MNIYDSGTLIWVDDDFEHDELMGPGRDGDIWRRIFGDADSRVYWLLNLNLEIATCAEDAINLVAELASRNYASCLVQGILDLRIPARVGGDPEKKFGLQTASEFKRLGLDYSFLSSKAESQKDLMAWGLEGSNYSTKRPAPNATMMPDELARRVLQTFKSGISWIDISPLLDLWVHAQNLPHPLRDRHPASSYFPFFSSCRDFIERWEARQVTMRRAQMPLVVLRAPQNHSDEFIAQCLSIILAGRNPEVEQRVIYAHASNSDALAILRESGENVTRVVRLSGKDEIEAENECEILKLLLRERGRSQLFFIVPKDEQADLFLEVFANESDVLFDDLPAIQIADFEEREMLVRKIVQYHLQNLSIPVDGGMEGRVNDFYLEHPETLFNPLYWTFLLESEQVTDDLTDPYEMQHVIYDELQKIKSWPGAQRQCILEGSALTPDYLLKPAERLFEAQTENQFRWTVASFRDWLVNSWRTPFGCIDTRKGEYNQQRLEEWEWLSLLVARDLAQLYISHKRRNKSETQAHLDQVADFILNPAIDDVVDGHSENADWFSLEALRWPHAFCPMPSALNRRLKEEGRYFFLQTDRLDRVAITRRGMKYLLRLEDFAEFQESKLNSIARNAQYLPKGWAESVLLLSNTLETGKFASIRDETTALTPEIWNAIQSLAKNTTLLSFIFHTSVRNNGTFKSQSLDLLVGKQASDKGGEGRLLGAIRGYRRSTMTNALRPKLPRMRSFAQDLSRLQLLSKSIVEFAQHDQHDWSQHLVKSAWELLTILSDAPGGFESEMSLESISEWMVQQEAYIIPAFLQAETSLHTNEFFQNKFVMSSEMRNLAAYFGTMRGSGVDLLLWFFEWADLAHWCMREIQYADGYHFISLVRDQRNELKDTMPDLSNETVSSILEMFLYGFDGIVLQLKHCLAAAGHLDLAEKIEIDSFVTPTNLPRHCASIEKVMQVRKNEQEDGYELFLKGYPGGMRNKFGYLDAELGWNNMEG